MRMASGSPDAQLSSTFTVTVRGLQQVQKGLESVWADRVWGQTWCAGWNEMLCISLWYLNAWSVAADAVWEGVGGGPCWST